MERIRERRRAAEAKQSRQVDTSNLSVGFMSKSQRVSNMPSYPGLDRWRLLEKIGDGAFSCVYRASDTKSEFSEVAIKVTKKYEMKEEQVSYCLVLPFIWRTPGKRIFSDNVAETQITEGS
jgi:serine/threonine protein kinase